MPPSAYPPSGQSCVGVHRCWQGRSGQRMRETGRSSSSGGVPGLGLTRAAVPQRRGPFRRTKNSLDAAEAVASSGRTTHPQVESHGYRRLGEALAVIVVAVKPTPRGAARLRIAAGSATPTVDAMLVTHEAPGADDESHRVWFVTDLSSVMFADASFALLLGEAGRARHRRAPGGRGAPGAARHARGGLPSGQGRRRQDRRRPRRPASRPREHARGRALSQQQERFDGAGSGTGASAPAR